MFASIADISLRLPEFFRMSCLSWSRHDVKRHEQYNSLLGAQHMSKQLIFGGADGTGDFFDRDYAKTFVHSHVNLLAEFWKEGPAHYRRGPWWQGTWTYLEAWRIYEEVRGD